MWLLTSSSLVRCYNLPVATVSDVVAVVQPRSQGLSSLAPGVKMRDPGNEVGCCVVHHTLMKFLHLIILLRVCLRSYAEELS